MNTEKLAKLKELRSQMEGVSIKLCQEALEKNNYDLQLAQQWLQEKAKIFRKDQGENEEKQKFGVVSIKKRENEVIAFLLVYTDPSMPSESEELCKVVESLENILLDNFSSLYEKSDWKLPEEVQKELNELSLRIKDKGVKLEKCRFFQQKANEHLGIYLHHNKKIGALVLIQGGDEEIAHELALQIVANKPQFLSLDNIPQDIKEKEKQKFLTQIQEKSPEKKPDVIQKIVQDNLDKYLIKTYDCFLEQADFRDPETKIKDYLAKNQVKVKEFYLLTV
ncbi:translation elongation factor Ts [endosymbiont GvMRE of Glomus versiforme]|uniref:translation elongation factor Ts n=1 Tax=endosymbiont GvMRE of Glomus versiforme TaxID=2039283 RepID=UPI000ED45B4B|nr:translation elongation factor Ts [endosymbiont GvMRE of Glomus versiforme]RHZ37164.1 Elongation factor Ts [endosymbiont GvMRE of Glomus versiforme]